MECPLVKKDKLEARTKILLQRPNQNFKKKRKTSTEVLRRSPQWAFNTHTERKREREREKERERERERLNSTIC